MEVRRSSGGNPERIAARAGLDDVERVSPGGRPSRLRRGLRVHRVIGDHAPMSTASPPIATEPGASPKNPSRRHLVQLARFSDAVASAVGQHRADPRVAAGHFLYKADGRTPMFYLESLARIGRHIGPSRKLWESWLPRFKEIEDLIGAYDYWVDIGARSASWHAPAPLLAYFTERAQQALGAMEYALGRSGFWAVEGGAPTGAGSAVAVLRAALAELDWDKPKRERKAIAAFLRDEVREITDKLGDGTIDLENVELGIHELRRRLRWLPICGLALAGKVVLDETVDHGALAKYVTPESLANPFNQLPGHPDEAEPVRYHQSAFLAVSFLISEIGKLKDRALWTEELERSSRVVGVDPAWAQEGLAATRIMHPEVVAAVRTLAQQTLTEDRALEVLAEHLDAQT